MAPHNIITAIVPLAGNEAALGLGLTAPYLITDTTRVINNRDLTLVGPLPLAQGGVGVMGCFPVFLPNGTDPTAAPSPNDPYWGIIISLVGINRLIELGNLDSLRAEGYEFTLRDRGATTPFYSSASALTDPIVVYLTVPHGQWELQIAPAAGHWQTDPMTLAVEVIIAFVISLLSPLALLITLKNNVLFNNARAMQKQIDSGKEREKKMEVGMIELDRKLSEATQTIVRRTREIGTVAAAYQLCRDMFMLINISRPQSSVTSSTATTTGNSGANRGHIIQHAADKARHHAQQLTAAQRTQSQPSRGSASGPSSGAGTPVAIAPRTPSKTVGGSSPLLTAPMNGDHSRAATPTSLHHTNNSTDVKIDLTITVEQIANHPIAVEFLKDVMAADRSLENLMFYLDVRYYRKAYDDNQRGIMSGASVGSADALIRNMGEDIFCTYIGALAPCEINISRDTRAKLQRSVGGGTPPSSMTYAAINGSPVQRTMPIRNFTKETFDGALHEIKQLIRDNGIRQLQRHQSWPLCLQMLEIIPLTRVNNIKTSNPGDSGIDGGDSANATPALTPTGGAILPIGSSINRHIRAHGLTGGVSSAGSDEEENDVNHRC